MLSTPHAYSRRILYYGLLCIATFARYIFSNSSNICATVFYTLFFFGAFVGGIWISSVLCVEDGNPTLGIILSFIGVLFGLFVRALCSGKKRSNSKLINIQLYDGKSTPWIVRNDYRSPAMLLIVGGNNIIFNFSFLSFSFNFVLFFWK